MNTQKEKWYVGARRTAPYVVFRSDDAEALVSDEPTTLRAEARGGCILNVSPAVDKDDFGGASAQRNVAPFLVGLSQNVGTL